MSNLPKGIFIFDGNHRVYPPRKPGELYSHGGPIWREHWVWNEIVSETSRSWVTRRGEKIPKKEPLPRGCAWTKEDIEKKAWVHENLHKITRVLERCGDDEKIRKIAEILEYES